MLHSIYRACDLTSTLAEVGSGMWPGRSMHMATSLDIAQLAGVSQSTVSRALRGDPMVNEKTRERVREIARRLDYTVDKNASNLRSQQTRTLALLFFEDPTPDESN